jgi:hypothetical protein
MILLPFDPNPSMVHVLILFCVGLDCAVALWITRCTCVGYHFSPVRGLIPSLFNWSAIAT